MLAWADRHRWWLFVGLLLVYLAGFNRQWRPEPDSALYLSIGRNLVEGAGYSFHGKAHRLAYPGLPLGFAALFKLSPTGGLTPALVLMPVLGLTTLALVYRLFLLHAGRPTAVLVTLGAGMSRLVYRYSFELLTDLPFLLGVMMFLVGYEAIFYVREKPRIGVGGMGSQDGGNGANGAVRGGRPALLPGRWYDYALLVAGVAVAVAIRPAMWALVFAVVAALAWSAVRGGVGWGQVAVCAAIIAVVALFYLRDPRHRPPPAGAAVGTSYVEEDQMFQLRPARLAALADRARRNLPAVFGKTIAKAAFGAELGRPASVVLDALLVGLGIALVRARPVWGLFMAATVGMVLLVPKPQERYFLPVLPLLVYGWWAFIRRVNHWLPRRWGNWAFIGLFAVGAGANGEQVFDFIREQRHVPFLPSYKDGRYASAYEAADMLRRTIPAGGAATSPDTTWVLVAPKFGRVLSYLSGRYATEPDDGTAITPHAHDAWRHIYVLEPSSWVKRDADDTRPTVHQWLAARGFEVTPDAIATVPNADPDAKGVWSLHAIRPRNQRAAPAVTGGLS